MRINKLIESKISKLSHSPEEIQYIVNSYTDEKISDQDMTKWLQAVYINGMTSDEATYYTESIIKSGEQLSFKDIDGFIIDKHSTGGVGDKISLILGPILAACGCYVPMIVGRTLAHTGGTLDKLESIPGYNGLLSVDKFKKIVKDVGLSIIGQTDEICPADKKIYSLRDKTNTIDSFPLICGSIMGKKIAEGIKGLILDIKVGNGAFMKTKKDGIELGSFLKKIGEKYGIQVKFSLTDMNQPLGDYSGLLCEVFESLETLEGNGPPDILEIIYYLGEKSLKMANINNAKSKINEVINNGQAYEILCKMISEHGGLVNKIKLNPQYKEQIIAKEGGYINSIDTVKIGFGLNNITINEGLDPQAGFKLIKRINSQVNNGDVIAEIFSSNKSRLSTFKKIFEKSIIIKGEKNSKNNLIKDGFNK